MNSTQFNQSKLTQPRRWWIFGQRRRPQHDPMLALNMSLFNFESPSRRMFNPLRERENVWA